MSVYNLNHYAIHTTVWTFELLENWPHRPVEGVCVTAHVLLLLSKSVVNFRERSKECENCRREESKWPYKNEPTPILSHWCTDTHTVVADKHQQVQQLFLEEHHEASVRPSRAWLSHSLGLSEVNTHPCPHIQYLHNTTTDTTIPCSCSWEFIEIMMKIKVVFYTVSFLSFTVPDLQLVSQR